MNQNIMLILAIALLLVCVSSFINKSKFCDLNDHKTTLKEIGSASGKLADQIHKLEEDPNAQYSLILSNTTNLLKTTKLIQVPGYLKKAKRLLISTIESTLVVIKFYQAGKLSKAITEMRYITSELSTQFVEELLKVKNNRPVK